MHIYSPIGKKYAYFSPIDSKYTKLQKKRLNIFRLRRAPLHYNKFQLGKKYKSTKKRGGGIWNSNLIYTPVLFPLHKSFFLADKGFPLPPWTDMSAKNISFFWRLPLWSLVSHSRYRCRNTNKYNAFYKKYCFNVNLVAGKPKKNTFIEFFKNLVAIWKYKILYFRQFIETHFFCGFPYPDLSTHRRYKNRPNFR